MIGSLAVAKSRGFNMLYIPARFNFRRVRVILGEEESRRSLCLSDVY
jgi:hypothetical protein